MAMSVFVVSSSYIAAAATSLRVPVSANGMLSRRQAGVVRCQSEPEQPTSDQPIASTTPPPQPAPKPTTPKVSTKFSDVLAFSGPAPERINGRLAMLGFVAALGVEAARGDGLFTQLTNGGFPWFVATAVLFSAASLVPLFKGQKVETKSDGLMNANAEMWNGRFAMLGLVALAFTEYLTGGPLV